MKIRVLDSLGCAYGAIAGEPVRMLRKLVDEFGGKPLCALIGGGRSAPDRAAFYNGALVRYLDYNDSYLAKGETCHPSDSLGAVLAAAEYAGIPGKEFLTALAVAYQVQCRLSDAAPVRARGFDHVTHGAIAAAAGAAKALRLDPPRTANAVAIAGTANNALRVTRTGELSHWKGLAAPNAGAAGLQAAFLAMRGVTGPREMFEGVKGWMQVVSGPFEIDWEGENLERVNRTILKKYNAEIHSQSAIEGMIGLMAEEGCAAAEIERIRIDIFDVAHLIIGGGAEGDKTVVRTKEEADHSLPYIVAVAALDGEVTPAQYSRGADRAGGRATAASAGRGGPGPGLLAPFPGRARLPADRDPRGRTGPCPGDVGVRGVPYPADVVGERREEVFRRGGQAGPGAPGRRREGGGEPGEDLRTEPGHAPGSRNGRISHEQDTTRTRFAGRSSRRPATRSSSRIGTGSSASGTGRRKGSSVTRKRRRSGSRWT